MATAPETSARLWRWQAVLVVLTAAVTATALLLVALMLHQAGVRPERWLPDGSPARPDLGWVHALLWPAVAAATVTLALLGAALVHAVRVATFAFRRQES
jgi:hypothetical protein